MDSVCRLGAVPRRPWRDIDAFHCSCLGRVRWQGAHEEGGVCTTPPIGRPYARAYQTKANQTQDLTCQKNAKFSHCVTAPSITTTSTTITHI